MAENPLKKRQELDKEIAKLNAEYLKASGREADKLLVKINKLVDEWDKLGPSIKKWNDSIEKSFGNLEDVDDELRSIGNTIGKNSAAFQIQRERIAKGAETLKSISVIVKDNAKYTDKDRQNLIKIGNEYKANLVSIANINRQYADGKINLEEANKLIEQSTEKYKENTSAIELSAEAFKEIGPIIQNMNNEINSFGNLAQKSLQHTQSLDNIFESFQGIPALGEVNKLLKTNIRDTLAFKAAVFALGAALGKAAYDYFGTPMKAALQMQKESAQNRIDTEANVAKLASDGQFIPQKIEQERLEKRIEAENNVNQLMHEAQFAAQKAANAFSASLQQGAAQFQAASKTALFGKAIGGVGYGAAQMQLAGIGAEKVASAMEAAGAATGRMPTAKMGADMAIMAERTGQSVDSIAQINDMFQRMDGVSASTAMNLQEGLRNMADQAGIGLGNLMKEVAEASKDALSYQIKSGPALAKQVAYAQSLGVNFGDVAKAGKNMVMNYKDSIKAEMQLSSLLGEQVDLSEVRAKFAAGDTKGALESLKAQGLNPEDMDMFQQDALSQALGGMDLSSLQKIATGTGAEVGNLTAGNAKGGNQQFLSTTQSAQATLEAKQASISANQAVIDAKLSQAIADEYLASPQYKDYLEAQNKAAQDAEILSGAMKGAWLQTDAYKKSLVDSMKLDFVSGIKESLMQGLVMGGSGLLATALTKLIPGGKKSATPTPAVASMSGGILAPVAGLVDEIKQVAQTGISGGESISGPLAEASIPLPVTVVGGLDSMDSGKVEDGEKKGFYESIKQRITNTWEKITGFFQGAKDGIVNMWGRVTEWFTGIGEKISTMWSSVTGWFTGIGTRIKEGFLGFVDIVRGKIVEGWNKITGFFSGLIDTIKNFFKSKFSKKGAMTAVSSVAGGGGGGDEEGGGADMGIASQAKAFSNVDFKGAGKGIGSFLQNVGKGAGTLIQNILTGIANGLKVFADPMVVLGAVGLGAAIVAIGAGIAGASWIMGKALPTLAEGMMAFNEVDGANLTKVGLGIGALGVGMAAMGAGAVIGGIGNLVGSLFGGGIEETIKKMETFSNANINVDKVKNNADAAVAYSKAMAAVGAGSAISGIGNLVGSIADGIAGFFGKKPPLKQMEEFGNLNIANKDKIKENAETFAIFGNAMSSYKGGSGSLGGVLGDALAGFFKVKPPVEAMKEFAKEDFGQYKEQIKANAEAFTLFGNAMSSYKGSSGGLMEVLAQGAASFLKVPTPFDKFKEFASIEGIDVEKTKRNAEAFTAFGNAMATYTGGADPGFWSSLGSGIAAFFGAGESDIISDFQRFSKIDASGTVAVADSIGKLSQSLSGYSTQAATAVGKDLNEFVDYLDDGEVEWMATAGPQMAAFGGHLNTLLPKFTMVSPESVTALGAALQTFGLNVGAGFTTDMVSSVKDVTESFNGGFVSGLTGIAAIADSMMLAAISVSELATSLNSLSSIDTAAINEIPWVKMAVFGKSGGKVELTTSASKNLNVSMDAAKNIAKMATNTEAMIKLNNTMAKLLKEGFFGGETSKMSLFIDGKAVNTSLKRYKDNTKAGNPDEGNP